jgi:glycosidase
MGDAAWWQRGVIYQHPRPPMDDFGYDVSDYTGVDQVLGTLADLDELVAAAHR